MRTNEELRNRLIKCVVELRELELRGIYVYNQNTMTGEFKKFDYSEQIKKLTDMIDECTNDMFGGVK